MKIILNRINISKEDLEKIEQFYKIDDIGVTLRLDLKKVNKLEHQSEKVIEFNPLNVEDS